MNYRRKSTRPRQPAAITPARIQRDDNCRFVGYVRVARFPFAFFPSAFLLLTVASLVRLCKGYALARRVEQRVGSRLPGVFAHYCQFCCWNSLKVAEHTDGNGGILVWKENNNNKIINSFGVKETNGWLGLRRIFNQDTPYNGRFVESTTASSSDTESKGSPRFLIAAKFHQRARLILAIDDHRRYAGLMKLIRERLP